MRSAEVGATRDTRSTSYLLFFKRDVREDEPLDADFLAGGDELLGSVGVYHVGVGHEHHGDGDVPAYIAHQVKDLVGGDAAGERANVGALDDGALRGRVRERDAQFDEVCPVFRHGANDGGRRLKVRVSAGDEGDERFSVLERVCNANISHGDPPLCTARWRRRLCRPGRRP